jgi:hypothetical protein
MIRYWDISYRRKILSKLFEKKMEVACFQLVHGFTNRWWKSVFNQALAKGRDREQEIVMPYCPGDFNNLLLFD